MGLSALLGEVRHWGWSLGIVSSLSSLPVLFLCFLFTVEDVTSQHLTPANCCHGSPAIIDPSFESRSRNTLFLL